MEAAVTYSVTYATSVTQTTSPSVLVAAEVTTEVTRVVVGAAAVVGVLMTTALPAAHGLPFHADSTAEDVALAAVEVVDGAGEEAAEVETAAEEAAAEEAGAVVE